jgi:acylphosphatase
MMTEAEKVRIHARVEGRVQGVNFRYFTWENALRLGISGWVRNRWDRSVEVVAEGEREAIGRFLTALRVGPRSARVTQVKVEQGEPTGEFTRFTIRRTV